MVELQSHQNIVIYSIKFCSLRKRANNLSVKSKLTLSGAKVAPLVARQLPWCAPIWKDNQVACWMQQSHPNSPLPRFQLTLSQVANHLGMVRLVMFWSLVSG